VQVYSYLPADYYKRTSSLSELWGPGPWPTNSGDSLTL